MPFIDKLAKFKVFMAKLPDEFKSEGSAILQEVSAEGNRLEAFEATNQDLSAKIEILEGTKREYGAESKQRKLKLQEYDEKLTAANDKIKSFEPLEQENKTLKSQLQTFKDTEFNKFSAALKTIVKSPNWEKYKPEYKLPEPDKEGKFNFEKMTPEDKDHNVNVYNTHLKYNVFEDDKKTPPSHGQRYSADVKTELKPEDIKSAADLQKMQKQELEMYK